MVVVVVVDVVIELVIVGCVVEVVVVLLVVVVVVGDAVVGSDVGILDGGGAVVSSLSKVNVTLLARFGLRFLTVNISSSLLLLMSCDIMYCDAVFGGIGTEMKVMELSMLCG